MKSTIFTAVALLLTAATAQAHFVWTRTLPGSDPIKTKIEVCFGEEAGAGEAHLVEKIKQTKTWPITAEKSETLSMTEIQEWRDRRLSSRRRDRRNAGPSKPFVTTASWPRAGAPFQLNYFAKTLTAAGLADPKNAVAKNSKLQISVRPVDHALELTLLWDGKPVAEKKILVAAPGSSGEVELTTDAAGTVKVETKTAGQLWALVLIEEKTAGEKDGKKFDLIKNYATLTVPVAGKPAAVATDIDLPALLSKGRDNRAVWEDFTGLKGNFKLSDNGVTHSGAFSIDEEGEVTLKLEDGPARKWALAYLKSMVQHRLPTANIKENVKYVKDNDAHPLGVKLSLGDGEMDSHYRVRDNAVLEVNRKMGKGRFTISVIETINNPQGKYLATVFTVNTWNGDGELISSMTESDEYTRIEKLDVPKKVTQTSAGKNQLEVRILELSDLEVPKAKATASK
ncbi:MAG: DUF3386 family protein [Pirellulales bacterium]